MSTILLNDTYISIVLTKEGNVSLVIEYDSLATNYKTIILSKENILDLIKLLREALK